MTNGLLAGRARASGTAGNLVRNWKFWAALAGGAVVVVLLVALAAGAFGSKKGAGPVEVRTPAVPPGPGSASAPAALRVTRPTAATPAAPPARQTPPPTGSATAPASGGTTSPPGGATTPPSGAAGQATLPADVAALLAEAEKKEQQGQPVAARKLYGQALARAADAAQRATIARKAVALAERTILSPSLSPGETEAQWYEVQAGDVLANIGPRFRIPYELIKRVNGLPSDTIRAGQKLKVVKGPLRARITKGPFTLELWLRDTLVKTYPVAIGVGDSTPSASYTVSVKQKNPTFYPPPSMQGRMAVKPGGAPDNPLGSRWIGFGDHLGLHGTNEPQSIGKSVSLGCIRMHNPDVEFLYDCLVQGSTVEIVD